LEQIKDTKELLKSNESFINKMVLNDNESIHDQNEDDFIHDHLLFNKMAGIV